MPGAGVLAQDAAQGADDRPNILFILTDDQPETTFTPEIMPSTFSGIVDQGLVFENGAVTTALCCPSRASILRGQYAHNTSIKHNRPPSGGFETFKARGYGANNLGVWMQQAGYRTGFFGKVMNGYGRKRSDSGGDSYRMRGWNAWYGYQAGKEGHGLTLNINGKVQHPKADPTVYFTQHANSFVKQGAGDEKPWLAYVAVNEAHAPYNVPKKYERKKGLPTGLETPESFNEADVSDKAPETSWKRLGGKGIKKERRVHAKRVRAIHAVDQIVVKKLLASLSETGQLGNTFVFFLSDNGMMEGRHRMSTKAVPYEEAHQVPFAVTGPGVKQGTSDALAANIDLAPTFLDIAGAPMKEHFDGESLLPELTGTGALGREYLMYEGYQRRVPYRAVRTADDYVYIKFGRSGAEEIYDLSTDPYQLDGTPAGDEAGRLDELRAKAEELAACQSEVCRAAD